jgi:hypothetical protein
MLKSARKTDLTKDLLKRLQDPLQLRIAIAATAVLLGFGAIYTPLSGQLEETAKELKVEKKRRDLTRAVEELRAQHAQFKGRLTEKADPNLWVQHVLGGIRASPLKLNALDLRPPRDLGPYKGVVLKIELEGHFRDLHGFLCWLETDDWLFRVETVSIAPTRQNVGASSGLVMHLTVVGVYS